MKIIEKTKCYKNIEIEEFCCRKMKKYFGNEYIIWLSNGKICIGSEYRDNVKIKYCPFCGEEIV